MSETMVGSEGLTVSALARRVGVGADTVRYYERAEFFRSARTVTTIARPLWSCLRHEHRSLQFGVPPHELTAAIDLALFNARGTRICLSSTGSNRQPYAPG